MSAVVEHIALCNWKVERNMSGDPEQDYFADGVVEEIITALSRMRWLFVIARNSSFTYKGRAVDVKQVARELGVRYVLEGGVRKATNRVRITSRPSFVASAGKPADTSVGPVRPVAGESPSASPRDSEALPRLLDEARQAEVTAHPVPQKYPRTEGVYAEWIAACKGGTPAGSNIPEHSGPLTEMVLLGNLAVRTAQAIDVNPANGTVLTQGVPEEYVKPKYRQGWSW